MNKDSGFRWVFAKNSREHLLFETTPHLEKLLQECQITFMTASELLNVTEESAVDFLARDPVNGYFEPKEYAGEVTENFLNNQTYYWEKMVRERGQDEAQNESHSNS